MTGLAITGIFPSLTEEVIMEYIYSKGEGDFKDELFVLFHGTGGNENSLLFLTGELNPHSGVLSFLGNVGEGKGRRFFNPLIANKLDKEDMSCRVDSFLESWDKMEIVRNKRLIFAGYSNGANFILGILQKRPDIAHRTLLLHPAYLDWNFESVPQENSIIATAGASDMIAPAAGVIKLEKEFRATGYNGFKVLLLDGGHGINDEVVKKLKKEYNQWNNVTEVKNKK